MAGSSYSYLIIGERIHIQLNRDEEVDSELLQNGLMFVVEEGVEKASTFEEVQALKIKKLIKMLQIADNSYTVLNKESLFECCYKHDHTFKGFMSYINSQNS